MNLCRQTDDADWAAQKMNRLINQKEFRLFRCYKKKKMVESNSSFTNDFYRCLHLHEGWLNFKLWRSLRVVNVFSIAFGKKHIKMKVRLLHVRIIKDLKWTGISLNNISVSNRLKNKLVVFNRFEFLLFWELVCNTSKLKQKKTIKN